MQPSATICRTQEAHHRALAFNADLPNVRALAARAADAWSKEAFLAEKREARMVLTRQIRDSAAVLQGALPQLEDRAFSENPDRGHAEPALG